MREAYHIIELAVIIAAAISLWIVGLKMRRRIKKTLGVEVKNESELTSLNTWMKVHDAEDRAKEDRSK